MILLQSKNGSVWKVDVYADEKFEKVCRKATVSEIKTIFPCVSKFGPVAVLAVYSCTVSVTVKSQPLGEDS